jgi:hypothetical protein
MPVAFHLYLSHYSIETNQRPERGSEDMEGVERWLG